MSTAVRRVPRQARAERRVAALLEAAAEVIAEVGYEAATLTAIAARAEASIGSLYQYFPDKPAIVRALAQQYGRELSQCWEQLGAASRAPDVDTLVDRMLETMLGFLHDRPAFLPLLSAGADYRHDPVERDRLRGHIAALLRAHQPALDEAGAAGVSNVVVHIFKGMNMLFAGQTVADRKIMSGEFRLLLKAYLSARLSSAS